MKVVIKEREFEYQSDYPIDWFFSAGDYFKFPVEIGKNKCFVKRFEKKSPESVSGWLFMTSLKGKYEKNLPRLHDIVTVKEKNKDVQYIFYDFIEGTTLDKLSTPPAEIDLQKLTDDIFNALNAVHKYKFWFADFCEKNIFCKNNGQFFLVDLDSVQPDSIAPNNEIYGSKDYWVVVYKFYTHILGFEDLKLSDIDGKLLNKLQVIFLILNIKLAGVKSQLNYSTGKDFDHLPIYLDNIDPAFGILFEKVFKDAENLDGKEIDEEIKQLISKKITHNNLENIQESQTGDLRINSFTVSSLQVQHDEKFTLNWEVENAKKLVLFRNDKPVKDITIKNNSIEITEKAHDGKPAKVEFHLIVSNKNAQIKSDLILISVEPKVNIILIPPVENLIPDEEIGIGNPPEIQLPELPSKPIITVKETLKDRPVIVKPNPNKKKRTLLYASLALILGLIALFYFKNNGQKNEIINLPPIDSVVQTNTPEPIIDSAFTEIKTDTVTSIIEPVKKVSEKKKLPKKTVVTTTIIEEEEEVEEEQKEPHSPAKEVVQTKASGLDLNDIKDKIEFVPVRGGLLNLGKVRGYVLKNNSNFDIKQIKIEVINANNNESKSFTFENVRHQSKSSPQNVEEGFKLLTSKNSKSFVVIAVD